MKSVVIINSSGLRSLFRFAVQYVQRPDTTEPISTGSDNIDDDADDTTPLRRRRQPEQAALRNVAQSMALFPSIFPGSATRASDEDQSANQYLNAQILATQEASQRMADRELINRPYIPRALRNRPATTSSGFNARVAQPGEVEMTPSPNRDDRIRTP